MIEIMVGNPAIRESEMSVRFSEGYPVRIGPGEETLNLSVCHLCGALVADLQHHAEFHYALIAGRLFGVAPPGFGV